MHMLASKHDMKHLLITTIAAVLLVGCGEAKVPTTSIQEAAKQGDIEAVKQFIANGADVNAKDEWLGTPLHQAAREDHMEIVELLIAKGADVNVKDGSGDTPLHYAVNNGRKEIAELLIANDADVNAKDEDG